MSNPKLALIPSAYKQSKVYSILPSNGDGDFTFTRPSSATRVNSNGLIESVGVNLPRLDYGDGNCPSLLLEPQRTNLITYSEDFSQWSSLDNTLNLIDGISPDGGSSVYELTSVSSGKLQLTISNLSINTEYTFSFYVKKTTSNNLSAQSRISSLTGGSGGSNLTVVNYQDELVTNEWVRITHTFTTDDTLGNYVVYVSNFLTISKSLQFYGAQLEQGSYATSYIPTNGIISTRTVETCKNAGNASTFNDVEGILFIEAAALVDGDTDSRWISINDGATNDTVYINWYANDVGRIQGAVFSGGALQVNMLTNTNVVNQLEYNKIAIKYKENDFALWINGVNVLTDTSGITPTGLNRLDFGRADNQRIFYGKVKQLQYFDTALTDLELQELTTL